MPQLLRFCAGMVCVIILAGVVTLVVNAVHDKDEPRGLHEGRYQDLAVALTAAGQSNETALAMVAQEAPVPEGLSAGWIVFIVIGSIVGFAGLMACCCCCFSVISELGTSGEAKALEARAILERTSTARVSARATTFRREKGKVPTVLMDGTGTQDLCHRPRRRTRRHGNYFTCRIQGRSRRRTRRPTRTTRSSSLLKVLLLDWNSHGRKRR